MFRANHFFFITELKKECSRAKTNYVVQVEEQKEEGKKEDEGEGEGAE